MTAEAIKEAKKVSLFIGEIAELKAGFKHEMNFNNIHENTKSEVMSWGVDSNVIVPAHYTTEASIVIEEMNYQGSYSVTSTLSGPVTVSIKRFLLVSLLFIRIFFEFYCLLKIAGLCFFVTSALNLFSLHTNTALAEAVFLLNINFKFITSCFDSFFFLSLLRLCCCRRSLSKSTFLAYKLELRKRLLRDNSYIASKHKYAV